MNALILEFQNIIYKLFLKMRQNINRFSLDPQGTKTSCQTPSTGSNQLLQPFGEQTCWKTNLMINQEVQRIAQRAQNFKKRTSFEENLINDHLTHMKQVLHQTNLTFKQINLPHNDTLFAGAKQTKSIEVIQTNTYLTEEQKWEITNVVLNNQQNFSIMMRLSSLLQQNKQELCYMLCKILFYISTSIKSSHKRQNIKQEIDKHRIPMINSILEQQLVKLISPAFFENENQEILMEIFNVWLYNILCIKHGIYEVEEQIQKSEQIICQEDTEDFFA